MNEPRILIPRLVPYDLIENGSVGYKVVDRYPVRQDIDMRTAAMVSAIDKVAMTYEELGIFP